VVDALDALDALDARQFTFCYRNRKSIGFARLQMGTIII
jgi:hypothetical protein